MSERKNFGDTEFPNARMRNLGPVLKSVVPDLESKCPNEQFQILTWKSLSKAILTKFCAQNVLGKGNGLEF